MSDPQEEYLLEQLNNIFVKCDSKGKGVVDIDSIITILIHQEPSWENDKNVEEQFRQLLGHEGSTTITQSYFTSSLLNWFKMSQDNGKDATVCDFRETHADEGGGTCSSQSSGFGEDVTLASSVYSIEDNINTVHYVSDERTLDENTRNLEADDKEGVRFHMRLSQSLKNEVTLLKRKNECLEITNRSLVEQTTSLEDSVAKKDKEVSVLLNKLESMKLQLVVFKRSEEEAEEKMKKILEENYTFSIRLSQFGKENTKLKELVKVLENEVDSLSGEKVILSNKIEQMKQSAAVLTKVNIESENEMKALFKENKRLQTDQELNNVLMQAQKAELQSKEKELTYLKYLAKPEVNVDYTSDSIPSSGDNSMVINDAYALDNSIASETSLLAELQAEHECDYACLKNSSFSSTSTVSTNTDNHMPERKDMRETATMTEPLGSLHEAPDRDALMMNICNDCQLKSNRLMAKWVVLSLMLLTLGFLLGLLVSSILVLRSIMQAPRPSLCLSHLLDLFRSSPATSVTSFNFHM